MQMIFFCQERLAERRWLPDQDSRRSIRCGDFGYGHLWFLHASFQLRAPPLSAIPYIQL